MKVTFFLIFLLSFSCIYSADLSSERVGQETLITLRIDTNELFSKKDKISYRVIFEVLDDKGITAYLMKKDIEIAANLLEDNQRLIYSLKTDLVSGEYKAYLKLNNKLRKDKKEEKFEFTVDENQHFSNLYLLKKVEDIFLEVLAWDDVNESQSVFLYQLYEEKVAGLKLVSENSSKRKVTELSASKELNYKLEKTDLLEGFTNNYIEFTLQNRIYQKDLKLEQYLNSFQRKYSWEDQLNQIKYIVNDKTWKEINSNKKLTTSERVLGFWDLNNPKESNSNTLQDVFYNRVLYADRKFSVHRYKQGWETDRGRIYIKFGEPDEINADNNPIGKYPTQTWYYYRLNKTFIFYDRSRIEDYKLYNKEEEYDF